MGSNKNKSGNKKSEFSTNVLEKSKKIIENREKAYSDNSDDDGAPEMVSKNDIEISKLKELHESLQDTMTTTKMRNKRKRAKERSNHEEENDKRDNDDELQLDPTILAAVADDLENSNNNDMSSHDDVDDNNENDDMDGILPGEVGFKIDKSKSNSKKFDNIEVIFDDSSSNTVDVLTKAYAGSQRSLSKSSTFEFLKNNGPGATKKRVAYSQLKQRKGRKTAF